MNFEAMDERMRRYEIVHDICVLPEIYLVARLDGRGFTRLTRERHQFDAPFDPSFRTPFATIAHFRSN
jgi:tRNA(His) guanylyltransferase